MDTIRTTALTFIAMIACLTLLLTPVPQQNQTLIQMAAPGNRDNPIRLEQAQIVEPGQPILLTHEQINEAITNSTPEQTTKEPFVLYPKLEQIRLLENSPAAQAILELQPMLSNIDPVIRLAAIESLGDMTNRVALPALSAVSGGPNPQLRIAILEALASQEDESMVSNIEPYLYDSERDVRGAAIEALADLESETAVHALAGLLSDQDTLIRQQAVNALGEIGGENAISYLSQARYDPDKTIQAMAESILSELLDDHSAF